MSFNSSMANGSESLIGSSSRPATDMGTGCIVSVPPISSRIYVTVTVTFELYGDLLSQFSESGEAGQVFRDDVILHPVSTRVLEEIVTRIH